MTRHPGGDGHTRELLRLAALPRGARILDMGAGDGEALRLMRAEGFDAAGIDLAPGRDEEAAVRRCRAGAGPTMQE